MATLKFLINAYLIQRIKFNDEFVPKTYYIFYEIFFIYLLNLGMSSFDTNIYRKLVVLGLTTIYYTMA